MRYDVVYAVEPKETLFERLREQGLEDICEVFESLECIVNSEGGLFRSSQRPDYASQIKLLFLGEISSEYIKDQEEYLKVFGKNEISVDVFDKW